MIVYVPLSWNVAKFLPPGGQMSAWGVLQLFMKIWSVFVRRVELVVQYSFEYRGCERSLMSSKV